jgi:putative ABC transport system substrate-binding protein
MTRRAFIMLLGGAAGVWPLTASAQQATIPIVGYLYAGEPEPSANFVAAFRKGLHEAGYVEGRNVAIEYRFARNENDRLPELAADLVRHRVTVIATPGSLVASLAAKAATTSIPIVFQTAADPVQMGLVASLNRPGGNATGIGTMTAELGAKRFELLHELLPSAERFAALVTPTQNVDFTTKELYATASSLGKQIEIFQAGNNREIDSAFARLVQSRINALIVNPGPLFNNRRVQIVTLAAHHRLPAIYTDRPYAEAGGLMTYGSNVTDQVRQVGIYTGRILNGEKPADIPVLRASKFEFIINLQTARTLGLEIPPMLLARADEVIE